MGDPPISKLKLKSVPAGFFLFLFLFFSTFSSLSSQENVLETPEHGTLHETYQFEYADHIPAPPPFRAPNFHPVIGGLSLADRLSYEAAEKLNIAAENPRQKLEVKRSFHLNMNMNFQAKVSLRSLPKYHFNRVSRLLNRARSTFSKSRGGGGGKPKMMKNFDMLNHDHESFLTMLMHNEQIGDLRELWNRIVVNPGGVTCHDLCTPAGSIFGLKGLCTRDFCRCMHIEHEEQQKTHNNIISILEDRQDYHSYMSVSASEGKCRRGHVFDPVRLACADPRATILCSDHQEAPQEPAQIPAPIYSHGHGHGRMPNLFSPLQNSFPDISSPISNYINVEERVGKSGRGFMRETQAGWVMAPGVK